MTRPYPYPVLKNCEHKNYTNKECHKKFIRLYKIKIKLLEQKALFNNSLTKQIVIAKKLDPWPIVQFTPNMETNTEGWDNIQF